MAITLPIAAVNATNVDAGTDNPSLARADILDLINKVNTIFANLSTAAAVGAVVVRDGSGNLAGNVTGSSASCTGSAATATTATTATNSAGTGTIPKTAENGLRMLRGIVDASGGITGGAGFTVTKTGTGIYSITFATAFSAAPTVVSTAYGQFNFATAQNYGAGVASCTVRTSENVSGTDTARDCAFTFIAIGPN